MNNSDTSHYENVPFEVPESWEWVTVGDIFIHNTGKALNSSNSQGEIMSYITTSNLYWNRFDLTVIKEMPFTESEVAKCTVTRGDLLVCEGGDIGRAAIWNYDFDIRIQNHIHRLRSIIQLNHLFYYHVFHLFKSLNLIGGKGVAIQGLSSSDLAKLLVPLPPISEQNRIVFELNRWLSFVDQIELDQYSLKNTIADIKNRILCLAISGKLVGQDISDEPAIEILKKINPSYISCDNRHYENLPETWEEVELGAICQLFDGKKVTDKELVNLDVKYLRGSKEGDKLFSGKYVRKDALMILVDGENSGEVFITPHEGYQGSTFKQLRISSELNRDYVLSLIQHSRELLKDNKVGSAIPHLNKKLFKQIHVPIPPYNEQERIVQTVQTIMFKLDEILADL